MIHTTLEQSKALMHLGLREDTADLYYQQTDDPVDVWKLYLGSPDAQNIKPQVPCWSAGALLDILPDEIYLDDTVYYLNIWTKNAEWYIQYVQSFNTGDEMAMSEEGELINSLFKIVEWLLTNKLL